MQTLLTSNTRCAPTEWNPSQPDPRPIQTEYILDTALRQSPLCGLWEWFYCSSPCLVLNLRVTADRAVLYNVKDEKLPSIAPCGIKMTLFESRVKQQFRSTEATRLGTRHHVKPPFDFSLFFPPSLLLVCLFIPISERYVPREYFA